MAASVQELLAVLQAKKSPVLSLLEGFAGGIGTGLQTAPDRFAKIAALRQAEEDTRRRAETDKMLKGMLGQAQDKKAKTGLNDIAANPAVSAEPSSKLRLASISPDARGFLKPTFKSDSSISRDPQSFQALIVRAIENGEMSREEGMQLFREKAFPQIITDPLGQKVKVTPEGTKPIAPIDVIGDAASDAVIKLRQTAPKLADRFDAIWDASYPDGNPIIRQSVEGASAAAHVQRILKAKTPSQVGLNSLGFYFARMAGSNSQLSDAEREVFQEPIRFIDRILNKATKFVFGDLSPQMKKDLINLADKISFRAKDQARKLVAAQERKAKLALGSFYKPGIAAAFPRVDDLITLEQEAVSPEEAARRAAAAATDNGVKILDVRPK